MESDYTWTRSNGAQVKVLEMNDFHLLAAIRKLEKGASKSAQQILPRIYFYMVSIAYSRGLGITDFQIRAFIASVVP